MPVIPGVSIGTPMMREKRDLIPLLVTDHAAELSAVDDWHYARRIQDDHHPLDLFSGRDGAALTRTLFELLRKVGPILGRAAKGTKIELLLGGQSRVPFPTH